MRILVDVQGFQNESRYRGIGRYSLEFTKALVRNKGNHEVILLLSSLFPESIESIRSLFKEKEIQIKVWEGIGPVSFLDSTNDWRRKASQIIREAFINSLNPDILIVSSLIEGAGDNTVTSVGDYCNIITATILYDLIPLIYKKNYLNDKNVLSWYTEKVEYLKKSDIFFAISESSKNEGINLLNLPKDSVINISAAVGSEFKIIDYPKGYIEKLLNKYGIIKEFIMYSGATDPRKNIYGLLDAYALLSTDLRASHQLILVGGMPLDHVQSLKQYARQVGLQPKDIILTERVTDDELVALYSCCKLFVLPSLHEGFGLPALEAMACGAPTIGSNCSSIPEVIGLKKALFDPTVPEAIAKKMAQALLDEVFRKKLVAHGLNRAKMFSWDRTASLAIQKLEKTIVSKYKTKYEGKDYSEETLVSKISGLPARPSKEIDLITCASAISLISPRKEKKPKIYIDISELHRRDSKTGIQRVVKNIISNLIGDFVEPYQIELVYATEETPYRHAAKFTQILSDHPPQKHQSVDDVIDPKDGDIFLCLDFQDQIVYKHATYYTRLVWRGVRVLFVVYDLLPITLPNCFSTQVKKNYENWLNVITNFNGAVCISKSVSKELFKWVARHRNDRIELFCIDWFHLGADFENENSLKSSCSDPNIEYPNSSISFLMVGTVEPRKGHKQVLYAFNHLWQSGKQVN